MKRYHVKITTKDFDYYVTDIEAKDEKSARKILKERWSENHIFRRKILWKQEK